MRARYNTSCVTANITDPGEKFENVPTVCFVYISEFDVFGGNKTTYHIDSVIRETGTVVDDKCYRIFVNTKVKDETEIFYPILIYHLYLNPSFWITFT